MPDVVGVQRHERLVLDHALQGRERAAVADVLEAQEPVDAEHQVGAALVAPQHLDEQRPTIVGIGEVGRGASRVDAGAGEPRQGHAGSRHGGDDRGAPWPLVGRPEDEQHRRAAHDPGAQRQDDVQGSRLCSRDAEDDRDDDHGPADAAPGAADPRRTQHDRGDHAGDERRADLSDGDGLAQPVGAVDRGEQLRCPEVLHDQIVQHGRDGLGHEGREDQHPEQPEPAAPQHDQADTGGDERGDALEEQVEDGRDPLGQGVEGLDQVALQADEGVRAARGDEQAEQHEQHADDEVEHVRRRAHVSVGRWLLDDGGHGFRRRGGWPPPVPAHRVGDRPQDEDDDGDDRVGRGVHGDRQGAHGHAPPTPAQGPPGADAAEHLGSIAALSRWCPVVMSASSWPPAAAWRPRGWGLPFLR